MFKKGIYIIFAFLALISCSKKNETTANSATAKWDEFTINPIIIDGLTFNLEDDRTIEWSHRVNDYIEKFIKLSPKILENKSEIEYAVCQVQDVPETHTIYQELGWTKTIRIKIKIKENTALPSDWDIAGAELYYYLGSGRVPGCMFQTKQERLFSGIINENINVVTDVSFRGIDEITPYTFKKQVPQITSKKFRQIFQEHFYMFGGRQLDAWTKDRLRFDILKIEDNLVLNLWLIEDDDSILNFYLEYNDITKPLQNKDDLHIALCAMISIAESYLEEYQVEQLAFTIEKSIPYLKKYQEEEQTTTVSISYWMPSGNNYSVSMKNDSVLVEVFLKTGE